MIFRFWLSLLAILTLSGCIESDEELIKAGEGDVPFESALFSLCQDEKGTTTCQPARVYRESGNDGRSYKLVSSSDNVYEFRLKRLNASEVFAVQFKQSSKNYYGLLIRSESGWSVTLPSCDAMSEKWLEQLEASDSFGKLRCSFKNRAVLTAYLSDLSLAQSLDERSRYKELKFTPKDLVQYEADEAAAIEKAIANKDIGSLVKWAAAQADSPTSMNAKAKLFARISEVLPQIETWESKEWGSAPIKYFQIGLQTLRGLIGRPIDSSAFRSIRSDQYVPYNMAVRTTAEWDAAIAFYEANEPAGMSSFQPATSLSNLLPNDDLKLNDAQLARLASLLWREMDRDLAIKYQQQSYNAARMQRTGSGRQVLARGLKALEYLVIDGRYSESLAFSDELEKQSGKQLLNDPPSGSAINLLRAEALLQLGQIDPALAKIAAIESSSSPTKNAFVDIVILKSEIFRRSGKIDEAMDNLISRLGDPRLTAGEVGRLLSQLGALQADSGETVSARSSLSRSVALLEEAASKEDQEQSLALITSRLKLIALSMGSLREFSRFFSEPGSAAAWFTTSNFITDIFETPSFFSHRGRDGFGSLLQLLALQHSFNGNADSIATRRIINTTTQMIGLLTSDQDLQAKAQRASGIAEMAMGDVNFIQRFENIAGPEENITIDAIASLADVGIYYLINGKPSIAVDYFTRASARLDERQKQIGIKSGDTLFAGPLWQMHMRRGGDGNMLDMIHTLRLEALWASNQKHDANVIFDTFQKSTRSELSKTMSITAARLATSNEQLSTLLNKLRLIDEQIEANRWLIERRLASARQTSDQFAEIGRLRRERENLSAQITREFPMYTGFEKEPLARLDELRQKLRENEAIILVAAEAPNLTQRPVEVHANIAQAAFGVYILAISKKDLVWAKSPMGLIELNASAAELRCQLDSQACTPGSVGAKGFNLQLANRLYAALISPVNAVTDSADRLIFVAGGSLAGLPFSTLVKTAPPPNANFEDAKVLRSADWLIKDHAVTMLPSAVSLIVLREQATKADSIDKSTSFLGIGSPVFGNPSASKAQKTARPPALPWTKVELRRLQKLLGGTDGDVLLDDSATERAIKAADLSKRKLVMFATHGFGPGQWDGHEEPGLLLTTPKTASAEDDGFLSSSEVAQLSMDADWILLSACRTAAADGHASNEALSGLARSFFQAGARSMLVAQWEVRDDVAAILTTETIAARVRGKAPTTPQALRNSILSLIEDRDDPTRAHPSVWAPFILVGDADF